MPSLPYMTSYGRIKKALEKIQIAATPERFTQEYLSATLGMKGGSARPVIPFLKRIGFLGTDGAPTEIYKEFRNDSKRGSAAARALRKGYSSLFEMDEKAHELNDKELKGLVVQATGSGKDTSTVASILGSFKVIKAFASFNGLPEGDAANEKQQVENEVDDEQEDTSTGIESIRLSYTINLNLPATSDITVFNAIFKSLKENLLRGGRQP